MEYVISSMETGGGSPKYIPGCLPSTKTEKEEKPGCPQGWGGGEKQEKQISPLLAYFVAGIKVMIKVVRIWSFIINQSYITHN